MRSLPLALLAAAVVACAPGGNDAATDTASATDSAVAPTATASTATASTATATDSARARRDTNAAAGSAGLVLPAPVGATPRRDAPVPRPARNDTAAVPAPRIKPPTKAPGGYIMVPRSAHDSLRMATPTATSTATSTQP